jgi:quinolinate synthase
MSKMRFPCDTVKEVTKLKRELRAIVLAHNYQPPEVQEVADFIGDSLELSIKASQVDANFIVFCGVDFMAEQAAIINEEVVVLHPDPEAKCPMAAMISVEEIHRAREQHPKVPLVIYVNSPALVKAEADYVVTSANAVEVVKAIDSDVVLFGPDRHLAEYVSEKTGKKVIPVPEGGYCPVHVKFNANEVRLLKSIYNDLLFIAHPECPASIRALADFIGSTSQMISFVRKSSRRGFLVGTEMGIIYRMIKENKDKLFIPASTSAICEDMKKITLDKVWKSLKDKAYRVEVDKKVAKKVKKALENTFNVLGVEPPWLKR